METLTRDQVKDIFARLARIMADKKDELIRLDGAVGDGDLGLTMERAFVAAREEVEKSNEPDMGRLLARAGMAIARDAPSTMGTLVATGFMSGGKAIVGNATLATKELATFFEAFVAGIMQRGKSKPGEKTVVDVLFPAARALTQAAANGLTIEEALRLSRKAAVEGLASSKDMVAQHGRVAYYQDQSRGKEDPGAVAGSYIIQGFYEAICTPGNDQ